MGGAEELAAVTEASGLGGRARAAVFQLLIRTVAMRGLSLAGSVALARLLTPADFGLYAIVAVVVVAVAMLGDLGIGSSLVRQRDEPDRHELATAWTAQVVLMCSAVGVIWLAAPLLLVVAPGLREDTVWLVRVGSIALLFTGFRMLPQLMLSRALRFAPLAASETLQQVAFYGVAIVLAWWGAGPWSFIVGLVAQSATGALVVNAVWHRWAGIALDPPALRRMLRFGVPLQLSSLTSWASDGALPLGGALAGGVAGVGQLQFASRAAHLASGVDEVVARVSFSAMSRLQDDPPRRRRAAARVLEATTLAVVLAQGGLVALAPELVPLVFSDQWRPAVVPLQLMALAAFGTVPARVLRSLLWSAGRSAETLRIAAAVATCTLVPLPFLVVAFGLPGAGLAALVAGIASIGLYRAAAGRLVSGGWRRLLSVYASGAIAIIAGWLVLALLGGIPGLAAASVVYVGVYLALLLVLSPDQVRDALAIIRGRSPAAAAA